MNRTVLRTSADIRSHTCAGGLALLALRMATVYRPLAVLVTFALLRGVIYATVLPAWDYNDEEQHYHYAQHLAEERSLPIMGVTYISPEIVGSASASSRWERLHLQRPEVIDSRQMGLEGYSYEAYQPPLYYAVLTLPYALLKTAFGHETIVPGTSETLAMLYSLRLFTVVLCAISLVLAYLLFRRVLASRPDIVMIAATILSLIPERTMAMSRVNNDVLLDLLSTAALLVLIGSTNRPPTTVTSLVLGVLVGLAMLAKLSAGIMIPMVLIFVAWQAARLRSFRHFLLNTFVVLASVAVIAGWFLARNFWLYGEVTGVSAFMRLAGFAPRYAFGEMSGALFEGIWTTRWSGVGSEAVGIFMALVGLIAATGLVRKTVEVGLGKGRMETGNVEHILFLVAAAVLWLVPLLWGVRTGLVQHVEGRFLLPAYAPIVALLLAGLIYALPARASRIAPIALAAFFAVVDAAYLIAFSLPYYYFQTSFEPALFFAGKPAFLNGAFVITVGLGYIVAAAALCLELGAACSRTLHGCARL